MALHGVPPSSHPADQQFPLVDQFLGQVRVQVDEEFFVAQHLGPPGGAIEGLEFVKLLLREVEAGPIDVFVAGQPADG